MEAFKKTKRKILTLASSRKNYFLASLLFAIILTGALANLNSGALAQSAGGGWNVGNYSSFGLPGPASGVKGIIENLLKWLLLLFGFFSIIGFVVSGIMYLVAAGDEDVQKRAKKAMTYSIMGVLVGLVGLIILQQVDALLRASDTPGGGGATPIPTTPGPVGT